MIPDRSDLKKVLDLQAYVDGEVSAEERRRVEALLERDPGAQSLTGSLRGIRDLVRSGEPEVRLTESREFYWAAIERGIRREAVANPEPRNFADLLRAHGWLRWALPALGVAAAGVMLMVLQPARWRPATVAALSLNHEVESESDDSVAFTFRAEHSGMSVVWVQGRHDF